MKRMIMAMVLIASVFTAKAQFQTQLEIKGDALFDEIERLQSQWSNHFDYTSLLALLDAVVKDPSFASGWSTYISSEGEQRQDIPVQCLNNAVAGYTGYLVYYGGGGAGDPPLPPAMPPYGCCMNLCQYNFIQQTNSCLGLPAL